MNHTRSCGCGRSTCGARTENDGLSGEHRSRRRHQSTWYARAFASCTAAGATITTTVAANNVRVVGRLSESVVKGCGRGIDLVTASVVRVVRDSLSSVVDGHIWLVNDLSVVLIANDTVIAASATRLRVSGVVVGHRIASLSSGVHRGSRRPGLRVCRVV